MMLTKRPFFLLSLCLSFAGCLDYEAELGSLSAGYDVAEDPTAGNGQFVYSTTGVGGAATLEVELDEAGTYVLWARVRSPSATPAVLNATVGGTGPLAWQVPGHDEWAWEVLGGGGGATTFQLGVGTHAVLVEHVSGDVEVDQIRLADPGVPSPLGVLSRPRNVVRVIVEAEAGDLDPEVESDYSTGATPAAASPNFVHVPSGLETASTHWLTVPDDGAYWLWARVRSPEDAATTFLYVVDGGALEGWAGHRQLDWTWARVGGPYTLSAGPVSVVLGWWTGTDATQLDQLALTNGAHDLLGLEAIAGPIAKAWPAGGAFDLLTVDPDQYVAFYDENRLTTVAHRKNTVGPWTVFTLPEPLGYDPGSGEPPRNEFVRSGGGDPDPGWDTHNSLALGVDAQGHLHLSGNMHREPMMYYRTTEAGKVSTLVGHPCMVCDGNPTEPNPAEVHSTYPAFFHGPNGEFLYWIRHGTSGNGDTWVNAYDHTAQTWSRFHGVPLLQGTCAEPCTADNAYPQPILRGGDGTYHLLWVWRQEPSGSHRNRKLSYVRSTDLVQWTKADGTPVPLPIRVDDGDVIDDAPVEGGLINTQIWISVDANDEPVVTYHRYDDPLAPTASQMRIARPDANGSWTSQALTDWSCLWSFSGQSSTGPSVNLGPIRVEEDGFWSLEYRSCESPLSWRTMRIDPLTMQESGTYPYPAHALVPEGMSEIEARATRGDLCDPNGIGSDPELLSLAPMRTVQGRGTAAHADRFFLRRERVPSVAFAKPSYCPDGEPVAPTNIRVYKSAR